MLTALPKGVQTKYWKLFWLKIFSICHKCQRHQWCTLSGEFSKQFKRALMGYSGAGGKLIHEKNWSRKSRSTVPLTHLEGCMLKSVELLRHSQHLHSHVYKTNCHHDCFLQCCRSVTFWYEFGFADPYLTNDPASDPTPDPTPFFSDFKDAK